MPYSLVKYYCRTPASITRTIDNAVGKYIDKLGTRLYNLRNDMRKIVQGRIREAIMAHQIYSDIASGAMDADLGFEPGQGKEWFDNILDDWVNNITVDVHRIKRSVSVSIKGIISSFADALKHPDAQYRSEPSGELIKWLKWLLLEQDSIDDYVILYGDFWQRSDWSRSGRAIMVPSKSGRGYTWPNHLPAEYAGSYDNNFIKESVENAMPLIQMQIQEYLKSVT